MHRLTITSPFTIASIGLTFRVKVVSFNIDGETESAVASVVLGDVPNAPSTLVEKVSISAQN